MFKQIRLIGVAGLVALTPVRVFASGTFIGRGVRPPPPLLSSQYDLGKEIFTGKAAIGNEDPTLTAAQLPHLQELQSKLPKHAKASSNLPSLAGKLKANELEALDYYLRIRYGIQ